MGNWIGSEVIRTLIGVYIWNVSIAASGLTHSVTAAAPIAPLPDLSYFSCGLTLEPLVLWIEQSQDAVMGRGTIEARRVHGRKLSKTQAPGHSMSKAS